MKPSLPETVAAAVAAADIEGGKCWCWTGAGSSLLMCWWLGVADICAGDGKCLRLVEVRGAPCAAAAVAPAAAVCVGGGAGEVGACAADFAAAAADDDGGGGLQSSCLNCCRSRVGEVACRQVLAEGVGNLLPLPKFDQDCCPTALHHQFLSIPTLFLSCLLQLDGQVYQRILQAHPL
eukprot:1141547-Pelagomonas_calceolata.AAC.2